MHPKECNLFSNPIDKQIPHYRILLISSGLNLVCELNLSRESKLAEFDVLSNVLYGKILHFT